MTYTLKISENILKKRKEKNITQEQLADYMMVTKASVSKWETGQSHPDILLLPKLASYFNISIDELLGYQPLLSKSEIKELYKKLSKEVNKDNISEIIEKVMSVSNKYYSCFELLFYMGLFLLNNISFVKDEEKVKDVFRYAITLFDRICEESNDNDIIIQSLNLKAMCLMQLGEAEAVLDILPNANKSLLSSDYLVVSASFKVENQKKAEQKLQTYMYKNLNDLFNFLLMRLTLNDDKFDVTVDIMENLIEVFNIEELNRTLVLYYYLTTSKIYLFRKQENSAEDYVIKYLQCLVNSKGSDFNLKGDAYFDLVEEWFEDTLPLGREPNRDIKDIYASFVDIFINDIEFKGILELSEVQKLLKTLGKLL